MTAPGTGLPGNGLPGPDELRALVREVLRDELRALVREVLRDGLPAAAAGPGGGTVQRIERGAVTERAVIAAARAGAALVLGPRAVLTPLARDKARALGVPVQKER
ncbi:MAG TPA: hypothetical protein VF204_11250 [Streptosporangiaceae bacterium]